MTALEPGQLWVMRIRALAAGAVLLALAAAGETILRTAIDLPAGTLSGAAFVLLVYPVLISPGRRYRAWSFGMDSEQLRIAHGLWTRVETLVPLHRVQHIDVSQGPLERAFGVCRLVLHTAGTMHSRVVLPGLSRAAAESMRDEIRGRIGDSAG